MADNQNVFVFIASYGSVDDAHDGLHCGEAAVQ